MTIGSWIRVSLISIVMSMLLGCRSPLVTDTSDGHGWKQAYWLWKHVDKMPPSLSLQDDSVRLLAFSSCLDCSLPDDAGMSPAKRAEFIRKLGGAVSNRVKECLETGVWRADADMLAVYAVVSSRFSTETESLKALVPTALEFSRLYKGDDPSVLVYVIAALDELRLYSRGEERALYQPYEQELLERLRKGMGVWQTEDRKAYPIEWAKVRINAQASTNEYAALLRDFSVATLRTADHDQWAAIVAMLDTLPYCALKDLTRFSIYIHLPVQREFRRNDGSFSFGWASDPDRDRLVSTCFISICKQELSGWRDFAIRRHMMRGVDPSE